MTWRQYMAWRAWMQNEWNTPSRSDYYLMQAAYVTSAANSSKPGSIEFPNDFKLPFIFETNEETEAKTKTKRNLTVEQAAAASKARWRQRLQAAEEEHRARQIIPIEEERSKRSKRRESKK